MLLRRSPHSGGIPKKSPGRTPTPQRPSHPSHPTTPLQLLLLLCLAFVGHVSAQFDRTISEQESKSVVLPCPVNEEKCGKLHSLNWFKGDDRIAAMLLGDSNVTSVNKEFEDRVTVEQNPYRLVIKDLKIGDEDIYLCDTTFFIPEETCDNFNGYRVELRVLENIVPPTEVVILDAKGDRIENGSVVGPMQERQALKATCTVKNTRPQPDVGWFRGTKRLATYSPTHDLNEGLYTSTLELDWQLSREDLAQDIECRVESAAVKSAIVTKFSVDLQVPPKSILIKGVEHHTVQGSKVVLQCDIYGARPAVNLTWYNATSTISPEENDLTEIRTKAFEKEDGTYHTQSELVFNASRFENDRVFKCEAENIVLQINREKPISSTKTLEVLYPPVVRVSPPEMVTNTSEIVLLNCEYFANPASLTQVVWYRNGDIVNVNDTDHYQGGNSENVALVIKATDKEDVGNYSCQLSNAIGKGISEQQIDLDVQYVPVVEVLMIPEGPVKESDESNVTLFCNILEANPSVLTKVRWYANATLLKELPDCEETREDLCHIDPSKLLLESIGRGFFYNYSCEGFNAAGWGPRSEEKELMVHYEPGPATLTHFPLVAVKKKSVIFSCSVDDPGYPESNRYRWLRGGRGPLQDIVTRDWTVEPVGLDSRTNYSCYAYNEGGKGVMATVNLEVHAPPFFIKNLPQYTGVLHTTRNANLTCRIECVPRCEISWQKDGKPIEKNDTRYFVKEKYMDASPATGDFESMLSVLHFNLSNWPNSKFDILADNANYKCVSTNNSVGPGINGDTYLNIEYAPINTTVANTTVYVQEGTTPDQVICQSFGKPEPSYEWRFKDKTIRGKTLIINTPMQRNDSGTYTCLAFNKHGKSTAETVIDVQFKPRCEIERREIDDQDTLICTAFGNPVEADFSWSIKAENETVEYLGSGDEKAHADKSFYVLQEDYAIARTYRCVANNTVGSSAFCEIEVAEQLAWWQRWEKTTLIILVAAILGLLLAVIIICCIIICVCRRRRRQDKYHTEVSISASQSVLSYQPVMPKVGAALPIQDTSASLLPATLSAANHRPQQQQQQQVQPILAVPDTEPETENNNEILSTPPPVTRFNGNAPKSPPRWPLRPGVMLHVSSDTKENLAVNRMTLKPHPNSNPHPNTSGNVNVANASQLSAQLSAVLNESQTNSNSTMLTEVTVVTEAGTGTGTGSHTLGAVTRLKAEEEHLPSTDEAETAPEGAACLENLTDAPAAGAATASSSSSSCANASKVERILAFVFQRTKKSSDDGTRDSQRSHVGLLQTFWRGRGGHNDSTSSSSSPFGAQHRLKGIRCSGSVTYKKTPANSGTNETTTKAGETTSVKSPPSSVPSRASVTFQAPSLDKETDPAKTTTTTTATTDVIRKALAIPSQGAHSSLQLVAGEPATSSLPQQQPPPHGRSGRTPPPRPPPPTLPLRPPGLGHPQKALLKGTNSNSSPFSGIPIKVRSSREQGMGTACSSSLPPMAKRSILVSSPHSKVEHVQSKNTCRKSL
ncbi:hemicentin-1 isoform X16 [Drosophila obscura]|uniref:hemicentin-1 isoform X16 n=1 Tax=Drosophila obscura TaxID=7282 RepID=UPI001BB147CA|nr:hemicentin-1 isoform X16 [Drosophila obscura]